jgi:hypothetical protein
MAIAALSDVKRLLRIASSDSSKDQEISKSLESAESWVKARTRRNYGTATSKTLTFHNVRENDHVYLPDDNCTVTAVTVYLLANSSGDLLIADDEYQVLDGRTVQLLPNLEVVPFEGAIASRLPATYEKVTITYNSTGSVPEAVRDATAMLAASLYSKGPDTAQGIKSESLGDYSYFSTEDKDMVPDAVITLLAPFVRHRIQVT